MNVIINPSGSSGQSFKGLHAYLSHDPDKAPTSERVDWIESRNLANDDPNKAFKIMISTAKAQHELKRAAVVKAGKPAKEGPVMQGVLAHEEDEPNSREEMIEAADEYLSTLGVDPARMRAKNKPKRRQFADEHQVMMYAHNDTKKHHIHLMINKVHPEHGVLLPSNNEQRKASKWALEYSKRHGTDHKTPAREENLNARKAGKKIEPSRRKSRNVYEFEKSAVSNDNEQFKAFKDEQRKKDAALALRGRNMAKLHLSARDKLAEGHKIRIASLKDKLERGIAQAQIDAFESFRIPRRELEKRQEAERKTFAGLEETFFGRVGSVVKTVKLSAELSRDDESGIITRSFRILTNAGARKNYFDKAQETAKSALARQEVNKVREATNVLKAEHKTKMGDLRTHYIDERTLLLKSQEIEAKALKSDWKNRTVERKADMDKLTAEINAHVAAPDKKPERTLTPGQQSLFDEYRREFDQARQEPDREQDIERDPEDDRER